MQQEEWRPIAAFPDYQISNFGRVKNKNGQLRKPIVYSKWGYLKLNLSHQKDNKRVVKLRSVHGLVARAFVPNPDNKKCVNHKDNNPANNRADNLEWVTHKENAAYKISQGRHARGERIASAKLTADQVHYIRASQSQSRVLARELGVSDSAIRYIRSGKGWRHLL